MGLASSQARMLLLTARKSDLEYRAQAISQRRMNIAMQTEQLAIEHSNAKSNRKMMLTTWVSETEGKTAQEELSLRGLVGVGTSVSGNYLVTDAQGKYVYTDADSRLAVLAKMASMEGKDIYTYTEKDALDENGNPKLDENGNVEKIKERTGIDQTLCAKLLEKTTYIPEANNNAFFQDCLRNGSLFLQKANQDKQYVNITWNAESVISDTYDTSDDAEADAKYEKDALVLSNQDKMLDLELNQIQTQHTAIENEVDSVKKVIDKNIEKSFKIFS